MKALVTFIDASVGLAIKRPIACLFFFFVVTLLCLWQLKSLSFDSSTESFLRADDPHRIEYLKFEDQYGLSAYFIVMLEDAQLFSAEGVARLAALHTDLEANVSNLSRVESLINTRSISSEDDDIIIDRFLAGYLTADMDWQKKKQEAINTPYYVNRLVNSAGDAAGIILFLSQYDENNKRLDIKRVQNVLSDIEIVLQRQQMHFERPLLLGGSPVISAVLTKTTKDEMLFFVVLASLVVALILFVIFRRLSAVIFPLLCLFITIVMVLAIMARFQFAVQISSIILPSFLMAVGVANAVHFLRAFYPAFNLTHDRYQAIHEAVEHTGVAMFFTTLTTSVGLFSFVNSNVASIANFGIFSAMGVWFAYFITLFCLPAILVLLPQKGKAIPAQQQSEKMRYWLSRYVALLDRFKRTIVFATGCILALSIGIASQLEFSLNILEWFDAKSPIRTTNTAIEQQMGGTMQMEILVRNALPVGRPLTLEQLQMLDEWLTTLQKSPPMAVSIDSVISVLNMIKEANQVLLPGLGYQLPMSQELLAQILLLLQFDADHSLNKLMNHDMSEIRITLSIPWIDSLQYDRLVTMLEEDFTQHTNQQLAITMTGMATLTNKAFKTQIHSMLVSYIYAGVLILLLMMLLSKSIFLGTMIMALPNITPIAVVLAFMQLFAIPLDIFTILIGSIAIGLIVDDTIHLLYTFRRFLPSSDNTLQAMTTTLLTTGKALTATSLVLCIAFLMYCLSSLNNLIAFGYLTALCIALALIADLLVLPAILLLMFRNKEI